MRCQYNETDIEALVRAGTVLNFDCSPTLDIGPGLKVWRCFAFSNNPGVSWSEFETLEESLAWFEADNLETDAECGDCEYYLKSWCRGGCLARRLIRGHSDIGIIDQMNNKENVGIKV